MDKDSVSHQGLRLHVGYSRIASAPFQKVTKTEMGARPFWKEVDILATSIHNVVMQAGKLRNSHDLLNIDA